MFSQFDPVQSVFFNSVMVWGFWVVNFYLFFLFVFFSAFHLLGGLVWSGVSSVCLFVKSLFEAGMWRFSGSSNFLASVFIIILMVNWVGLLPGTFSVSSHFLFSVSLSVPLWLCTVIMNFSKAPLVKLGWFIGTGVPIHLASFIGLCEVVSGIMRPIALGLRLGANMLAGHVITSLVSNCSIYSWSAFLLLAFIIYFFFSVGLFMFEGAVCLIQAFVFSMLLQIYLQETPFEG